MDDDDKNQILIDPPIKLFGKSIQLPETNNSVEPISITSDEAGGDDSGLVDESDDEGTVNNKMPEHELERGNPQITNQQGLTSETGDIPGQSTAQSKTTIKSSRAEKENIDIALPEEKMLKKPDKIIPCPRCDSMDTKFCYFNNYNVNQPRYFCRKCQRYWTAGGIMRNLPVGAGRRKSKSSGVHYPTVAPLGEFQSVSVPNVNGTVHRPFAVNGSILSFAPDQHIHQISPPEVVEVAREPITQNGLLNPLTEAGVVINDNATGSAGSVSNIENEDEFRAKEQTDQSSQSFQPQMLCYPAPLWPPFPWNPTQYSYPLPAPINIQPGSPMPFFYPAPMYMGCSVPGTWNMPWSQPSSSPNTQSDPKSTILGKHSRDNNAAKAIKVASIEQNKEDNQKPSIWVPKTLRIDDLEEAAKSSMWATLGIKTDNIVEAGGKGHFKPFSSLTNETSHVVTKSSALLANPAALSRSMNFRESS